MSAGERFAHWFTQKWRSDAPEQLLEDYRLTFSSLHGQRVLQHLLDNVYCQICHSNDPEDLAAHNGRRSVVQEILENVDRAERPTRYRVEVAAHEPTR